MDPHLSRSSLRHRLEGQAWRGIVPRTDAGPAGRVHLRRSGPTQQVTPESGQPRGVDAIDGHSGPRGVRAFVTHQSMMPDPRREDTVAVDGMVDLLSIRALCGANRQQNLASALLLFLERFLNAHYGRILASLRSYLRSRTCAAPSAATEPAKSLRRKAHHTMLRQRSSVPAMKASSFARPSPSSRCSGGLFMR